MRKINKKLVVSIGTCAFNEENNIRNMLESVINQKENNISIIEIIVVSDGSTDKTVEKAKSINDSRIKVIDNKKRVGKASCVNELFKIFKGNVLVVVDSDMVLKSKSTIEKMVKKFTEDKSTALTCGSSQPFPSRNFLESAINNYIYVRNSLEDQFSFGETAYAAHGFLAYSKTFAKTLIIPRGILNDDAYSYFMCLSKGLTYYYAKDAVVLYRSPSSIKDFISQSARHLAGGIQLHNYFGKEFIDRGFYVPAKIKIKLLLYQLKKNPIGYIFLKLLNLYCAILSKSLSKNFDIKWKTIDSSKNTVNV